MIQFNKVDLVFTQNIWSWCATMASHCKVINHYRHYNFELERHIYHNATATYHLHVLLISEICHKSFNILPSLRLFTLLMILKETRSYLLIKIQVLVTVECPITQLMKQKTN